MKKLNRLIILCIGVGFACACSSETTSEQETTTANLATDEPVTKKPAPPAPQTSALSYHEKAEANGMRFDISTTGEGTMRSLVITVQREGQEQTRIDEQIEGIVENTEATDLNSNQKPELLVFVSGGGTGSYGQLYGYEFDNRYWGELHLPELTEAQREGYMGHDEFEVKNSRLQRSFPIYRDTDPNSTPTGGRRTITYSLGSDLHFKVTATSDTAS